MRLISNGKRQLERPFTAALAAVTTNYLQQRKKLRESFYRLKTLYEADEEEAGVKSSKAEDQAVLAVALEIIAKKKPFLDDPLKNIKRL